MGAGFLFQSLDGPRRAALALAAALYHTLNHAAFKALLFLGAGSVAPRHAARANMNRHRRPHPRHAVDRAPAFWSAPSRSRGCRR